jgi:hypothetical protein
VLKLWDFPSKKNYEALILKAYMSEAGNQDLISLKLIHSKKSLREREDDLGKKVMNSPNAYRHNVRLHLWASPLVNCKISFSQQKQNKSFHYSYNVYNHLAIPIGLPIGSYRLYGNLKLI